MMSTRFQVFLFIFIMIIVVSCTFVAIRSIIRDATLSSEKEIRGTIVSVTQDRENFPVTVRFSDYRDFVLTGKEDPTYINMVYAQLKEVIGNDVSIFYKSDMIGDNFFVYKIVN